MKQLDRKAALQFLMPVVKRYGPSFMMASDRCQPHRAAMKGIRKTADRCADDGLAAWPKTHMMRLEEWKA